jgi:hypothetical protein
MVYLINKEDLERKAGEASIHITETFHFIFSRYRKIASSFFALANTMYYSMNNLLVVEFWECIIVLICCEKAKVEVSVWRCFSIGLNQNDNKA